MQANIGRFGGDPAKVTIFGWSAGGLVVDSLIGVPPSPLPFRAGILESGSATNLGSYSNGAPGSVDSWNALADGLGCTGSSDVLACVRAADAFAIRDIIEHDALLFAPAYDNVTFPRSAIQARRTGHAARVPLMIGTNAQESTVYTALTPNLTVREAAQSYFPNDTASQDEVIALYAVGDGGFETEYEAATQAVSEANENCVSLLILILADEQMLIYCRSSKPT